MARTRGHALWRRAPAPVNGHDVAMRTWWALAAQRSPVQVQQYNALMAVYRGGPGQYAERQRLLAQIKMAMAAQGIHHPDEGPSPWGSGARRLQ